jgi:hypothetical protein
MHWSEKYTFERPPVAGAVMWVTFTPHGAHSRVRAETHDQVDARREPVQR